MPRKARRAPHVGPTSVCGAPGVGSVGPTARSVAPLARKTGSYTSRAAAPLAWAGAGWAQAAALAVPCPALPGGGGHATAETHATRPSPEDRVAPGYRPLSSQDRGTSPCAVRRYPGL